MTPPNPIDMTNNKKDFANIVVFCIFVLVTECERFQSYKDIYPIGLVALSLHHLDGVFLWNERKWRIRNVCVFPDQVVGETHTTPSGYHGNDYRDGKEKRLRIPIQPNDGKYFEHDHNHSSTRIGIVGRPGDDSPRINTEWTDGGHNKTDIPSYQFEWGGYIK